MNGKSFFNIAAGCWLGWLVFGCVSTETLATREARERVMRARELSGTLATYAGAPRLANGRIDVNLLVEQLVDIHANTYSFGIHEGADDWEDLKLFLPLARQHGIRVWGSIVPPTESPPHLKTYSEPFRLDYDRWAVEFARLSLRETNLVAWSIDDFTHNVKTAYTAPQLRKMLAAARAINPRLAFVPCCYFSELTPEFVKNYEPLVDGFLFPYRHESAGANLKDAELAKPEVTRIKEMTGPDFPVVVDVYATAHSRLGKTTPDYVRAVMIAGKASADGVMVYCHQDPKLNPEKYQIVKDLFTAWSSAGTSLLKNGGFEQGFAGWSRWGRNSDLITLESGKSHSGTNAARIQYGHNALFFTCDMLPGTAYALRFWYRLERENASGQVALAFGAKNGAFRSAGFKTFRITGATNTDAELWAEFSEVFMPTPTTATCQVAFSASANSTLSLDDVSLTPVARPADLTEPPRPWEGMSHRTANPLFDELLASRPGNYSVVCWPHDLKRTDKSGRKFPEFENDEKWQRELQSLFKEAGEAGMGFMDLPGRLDGTEPTRTAAFHAGQFRKYGTRFDVWTEGTASASIAGALHGGGAEILNPTGKALGKRAVVSCIDPNYVDTQERLLRKLGTELRDLTFVGVYYGKDEPTVCIPEGAPSRWGGYGRAMAGEILEKYGFGRLAAPVPDDPAFQSDTNKALRWIAYNRWMNDKFTDSRRRLHAALHEAHPDARYSAANYWFMSGFVPYDYTRLAASSDLMELDPYGSSAEARHPGRGVYNHGFGTKFMSDLTGKPVRVVAQAFDYAGYSMRPEDLREWVSQALRCGASAIDYYTLDHPRRTHRDRWDMMLHLSHQITRMNQIQLPDDPDTAVLYTLYTHMSQGEKSDGDQLYAAHVLIGELSGSWFKFVSDSQLERDHASLAGYKAVYLPLAKYMTGESTRKIEEYVRAGGVLVCGDAEAFTSDLAGNDTYDAQERILGFRCAGKTKANSITLQSAGFGLPAGAMLKLLEPGTADTTGPCAIILADPNAVILATYEDGTPAVISRTLGKGRVIAFAANPFTPSVAVGKSPWPAFFKGLQQSLGCKVERPIWRFVIPPLAFHPSGNN